MKKLFILVYFLLISIFSFAQSKFLLEYQVGQSYRYLTNKKSSKDINLVIENRDDAESPALYQGIKFTSSIDLNKALSLRTGLGWCKIGYTQIELKDLRWPSEITPNGYVNDPSLPNYIKISSWVSMLELPLRLRWNLANGKYRPFGEVGFSGQYYLKSIYQEKTDLGTKTKSTSDIDGSRLDIMADLSAGLEIQFTKPMSLNFAIFYGRSLKNNGSSNINEFLYRYGFSLGVIYQLEKNKS